VSVRINQFRGASRLPFFISQRSLVGQNMIFLDTFIVIIGFDDGKIGFALSPHIGKYWWDVLVHSVIHD